MVYATDIYSVVLAGGIGERLWPLSRQGYPKQFLSLGYEHSLLQQSIDRLHHFTPLQNIWAVTSCNHEKITRDLVGEQVGNIVLEPERRNTAAAILNTCFEIAKIDSDAVVMFVPSDPFIPKTAYKKFAFYAEEAIQFAREHNRIVLLGVQPTYPATGYGYIEYDSSKASHIKPVSRFHEKPSLTLAQNYIKQPNMLWNISMFCAKVTVFLKEFRNITPVLYEQVKNYVRGIAPYSAIESISVDYAIIEQSNVVSVLPVDFSWCDVGNVQVYLSIEQEFKQLKEPVQVEAKNNVVHVPNKTVALIGVDDLCVVETDDALLITKRTEAEKVRDVVKQLRQSDSSVL